MVWIVEVIQRKEEKKMGARRLARVAMLGVSTLGLLALGSGCTLNQLKESNQRLRESNDRLVSENNRLEHELAMLRQTGPEIPAAPVEMTNANPSNAGIAPVSMDDDLLPMPGEGEPEVVQSSIGIHYR
ncbi:MAG: hypothetical protein AAF517_08065, partial [Planctomycetota bacterium]